MRIPDRDQLDHAPTMRPAVLALGSNLGDRGATLRAAVAALRAEPALVVTAVSPVVESVAVKPDGADPDAPRYLNAVVLVETFLTPGQLLGVANRIEAEHGRVRSERWGDRTLDIDVVDFDGEVSDDPRLTLPHPRAHERAFVLVPWLAADQGAALPGWGPITALPAAHDGSARPAEGVEL